MTGSCYNFVSAIVAPSASAGSAAGVDACALSLSEQF